MKNKLFIGLLAIMLCFTLTGCGEEKTNNGGTNGGNSKYTASTDYFYDKHDFTEKWMMPDDGVYTGFRYTSPDSNEAKNEFVTITVCDFTEKNLEDYVSKILANGYEDAGMSRTYFKRETSATRMIQYTDIENSCIQITIDPKM